MKLYACQYMRQTTPVQTSDLTFSKSVSNGYLSDLDRIHFIPDCVDTKYFITVRGILLLFRLHSSISCQIVTSQTASVNQLL